MPPADDGRGHGSTQAVDQAASSSPGRADVATIGLVLHHDRDEAGDAAREVSEWLVASGHEVRLPTPDAALAGLDWAWASTSTGSPRGSIWP